MTFQTYDGSEVCPRCGSGWPCCAEIPESMPASVRQVAHELTCAVYKWGDLCDICEKDIEEDKK